MIHRRSLAALVLALLLPACQVETEPGGTMASPEATETVLAPSTPTQSVRRSADSLRTDSPQASPADSTALGQRSARPVPDSARVLTVVQRAARRTAALRALEDLAARADGDAAQAMERALDLVDERVAALAAADRPASLDSLRRSARAANRRGDEAAVVLAAAEAHRTLTEALPENDPARLRSAALVLDALVRPALPDWRAVRAATERLGARWGRAADQVTDARVHDAIDAAVEGATSGSAAQNAPLVRLAAEVVGDLAGDLPNRPGP